MLSFLNREEIRNIVMLENRDETIRELPANTPSQFIFSAIVYDAIANGDANIAIKSYKVCPLNPIKAAAVSVQVPVTAMSLSDYSKKQIATILYL